MNISSRWLCAFINQKSLNKEAKKDKVHYSPISHPLNLAQNIWDHNPLALLILKIKIN